LSAAKKKASPKKEPENFEGALERLEEIVEALEDGESPLEDSVGLYEEGVKLFRYCREQLNSAQKRVEELAGEAEEALSLRSFEDDEDEEYDENEKEDG